ncbi:hypothetical protein PLICRDRAFT_525454 [Plicaturopsis crispa FD-325 SS-3]|nr:hypothetical protein PLICRDRAFT_525454 [Plicaturopsis crispa FD-325 SS-3]
MRRLYLSLHRPPYLLAKHPRLSPGRHSRLSLTQTRYVTLQTTLGTRGMRGSCAVRRDIPPMHSPHRCSQVAAVDCSADTCMSANTVCLCRLLKRQARPSVLLQSPPQLDPVVKWQWSPYRKQLDGQIRLRYRTSYILWSTSRCGCWICKREALSHCAPDRCIF